MSNKARRQPAPPPRKSGIAGAIETIIRRLGAILRRQPAGRGRTVSGTRTDTGRVVEATRRRPSGASQPDQRKTAKNPQRRRQ